MSNNTKLLARVERILDIARRMADKKDKELGTYQVGNRIDDIQIYMESSDPGDSDGMHIAANWNNVSDYRKPEGLRILSDLPSRLCNIFEKMGIAVEWNDEVSSCSDCGKMIRTSPDSYSWQPSFVVGDGEILCHECVENEPEEHLESLEGQWGACNTIASINPADHGYVRVNDEPYESGFHTGMNDDPKQVANMMKIKGIERFLFSLDENSQFYSRWSCFVHQDEQVKL